jgi:hypothetical protein
MDDQALSFVCVTSLKLKNEGNIDKANQCLHNYTSSIVLQINQYWKLLSVQQNFTHTS